MTSTKSILSDSPKARNNPKSRRVAKKGSPYPDSVKMELIKTYLITGNFKASCAACNVPYLSALNWKYSQWWEDMIKEIKEEGSIQLTNKLKKIAEKALDVTLDRLENGDFVFDQKTGQMIRKPVLMRDANIAANSLLKQAQLIEDKPKENLDQKNIVEKLEMLKKQFENFSKPRVEVTDVIFVENDNALYAERPTRLQKGSGVGEEESHPQG